ncbi:CpsD/CapB family tyrosine-protein kinase [Alkalimarinus coralli]|uniref:CpsD/CapB family tyrosine-protein kinase n=1 Tax=Alkalimarinus coralli TaxID=2935863 RepID=UPI00202B6665|nr:CpsD/CapB family tyrosine-protein kinase [Alkalimarinus coralli]
MELLEPSELNLTSTIFKSSVRTLCITSANRGEGVTTGAISLAGALSTLVQGKVILVDGNWANPDLSKHFKLQDRPGVAELLDGNFNEFSERIHSDKALAFDVLPAGGKTPEKRNVWNEESWPGLLNELSAIYQYVVIDVGAVHSNPDSIVLARACDGTAMVVQSEATRWEVAVVAKDKLISAGINIVGAIFNRRKFYMPKWIYNLL